MSKPMSMNLQDVFLNQLRRDKVQVTLFLVNGFQIKGIIKGFDNFVLVMEVEGNQQIIYKHAISTIAPMEKINLIFQENIHQDK